ncbi:MAG TPA: TylF/MycF/NovP-related O-methyltransferase [Chthoniobacterales bacterium]
MGNLNQLLRRGLGKRAAVRARLRACGERVAAKRVNEDLHTGANFTCDRVRGAGADEGRSDQRISVAASFAEDRRFTDSEHCMIRRLLRKLRRPVPPVVVKCKHVLRDGLFTVNNDHCLKDPAFLAAYARGVEAGHGVDSGIHWRVHVALWAAATAIRVPGDFVECGVNAGFVSSAIMRRLEWKNVPKRFYLIDTFRGPIMAQYSSEEIKAGRLKLAEKAIASGGYVTDLGRIRENYAEWPNAVIIQGVVPEILPQVPADGVAFLHLDMNCACPERAALEFFWPRLTPGALVLFDDYSYFGCQQQAEAIDAAAAILGVNVLSLPTGQGLVIKPQSSRPT